MLNNKKIFIYNLCFGLSKLYINFQQDQKAKWDYPMSMLFAYMAGGRGGAGIRGFKMFCQRNQNFFYLLCVCVCVWGGGGWGGGWGLGQVQYLSFREKKPDPSYK